MKKPAVVFPAAIAVDLELVDKIGFGDPLIIFKKSGIETKVRSHRVWMVLHELHDVILSTTLKYPAIMMNPN